MGCTTLVTFLVQAPISTRSLSLRGSWDNFTKMYPMTRDKLVGLGHWKGCHTFTDIICDGDLSDISSSRDGGLRMGGTYWYYYQLDDEKEYHDPKQPCTTFCPLLPGQAVNVLEVPLQVRPGFTNQKMSSTLTLGFTLNPEDKYLTPKPIHELNDIVDARTASGGTSIVVARPFTRIGLVQSQTCSKWGLTGLGMVVLNQARSFTSQSDSHSFGIGSIWNEFHNERQIQSAGQHHYLDDKEDDDMGKWWEFAHAAPRKSKALLSMSSEHSTIRSPTEELHETMEVKSPLSMLEHATTSSPHFSDEDPRLVPVDEILPTLNGLNLLGFDSGEVHGSAQICSPRSPELLDCQNGEAERNVQPFIYGRTDGVDNEGLGIGCLEFEDWQNVTSLSTETSLIPSHASASDLECDDYENHHFVDRLNHHSLGSSNRTSDMHSSAFSSTNAWLSQPETPRTMDFTECLKDERQLGAIDGFQYTESDESATEINGFRGYQLPKAEHASVLTLKDLPPAHSKQYDSDSSPFKQINGKDLVEKWNEGVEHDKTDLEELFDDLGYLGNMIA